MKGVIGQTGKEMIIFPFLFFFMSSQLFVILHFGKEIMQIGPQQVPIKGLGSKNKL